MSPSKASLFTLLGSLAAFSDTRDREPLSRRMAQGRGKVVLPSKRKRPRAVNPRALRNREFKQSFGLL